MIPAADVLRLWPGQRAHLLHNLRRGSNSGCRQCRVAARAGNQGRGGSTGKPVGRGLVTQDPPSAPPPPLLNPAPAPDLTDAQQPPQPAKPAVSRSLATSVTASMGSEDQLLALRVLWRRLLIDLSSLPRAIGLMAATALFSGLGTIIPQNKPIEYYLQNYPEVGDKVLGFLTYKWVFALDLDHIYTAWYFYLTLGWLAASLMACTSTRQWPAVKVAQRWRFQSTPVGVARQGAEGKGIAEVLPAARLSDLGKQLATRGYQVFKQGPSLYAFKGLAGKVGPIGVHVAMLLVLAGTSYSGFGGFKGAVMMPEGDEFVVSRAMRPISPLSIEPTAASKVLHVNSFSIDYRPDGSVAQFYSDLSLLDPTQPPTAEQLAASPPGADTPSGRELLRKTISVNDPFRWGGVTMYQTDWSLSAVSLRILGPADEGSSGAAGGTPLTLPMASLEGKGGLAGRLWGSYLPVAAPTDLDRQSGRAPRGVSILARDPQSIVFYDSAGQFVGVRRPGSGKPLEVEGVRLVVDRVVGATGLEIKNDPGVPLVYAGFAGLMITTLVSYLSHSQVWALQEGPNVFVGGRSNRAKIAFANELGAILDAVPELPPAEVPERSPTPAAAAVEEA